MKCYPQTKETPIMRVLIVSKSDKTGGAAVAAYRLMEALNNNGVKARMLVRRKDTENISVEELGNGIMGQRHFLWERLIIYFNRKFNRDHLFEIDIANSGTDITKSKAFQDADVIHLHWINQGMLSLHNIRKILDSGKPVVWTMHDIWPATAICHYSNGCYRYKGQCKECKLLPGGGGENDLAAKVWRRKQAMLSGHSISYVACSKWLAAEAKQSALLAGQHISAIPNAIDTHVFKPSEKAAARKTFNLPEDKKVILFCAQKATDERKGMDYLAEALNIMVQQQPLIKEQAVVAVMGAHAEDIASLLPLPVMPLGYVADDKQIVEAYNAADVFVLPSVEDNLPNTIMEAMACGVPCVGFKTGGIPEMIDHQKNGYVATYRDAESLAQGMAWVLQHPSYPDLAAQAVRKVVTTYSQTAVALRYIEVYNQALAFKHYSI